MLAPQLAIRTDACNFDAPAFPPALGIDLTSPFSFPVEPALFIQLAPGGSGFFTKDLMILAEPARTLDLLVIHNSSSEKPTKDAGEPGTLRKKPLGVARVFDYALRPPCNFNSSKLDEGFRLQLAVGAPF